MHREPSPDGWAGRLATSSKCGMRSGGRDRGESRASAPRERVADRSDRGGIGEQRETRCGPPNQLASSRSPSAIPRPSLRRSASMRLLRALTHQLPALGVCSHASMAAFSSSRARRTSTAASMRRA